VKSALDTPSWLYNKLYYSKHACENLKQDEYDASEVGKICILVGLVFNQPQFMKNNSAISTEALNEEKNLHGIFSWIENNFYKNHAIANSTW